MGTADIVTRSVGSLLPVSYQGNTDFGKSKCKMSHLNNRHLHTTGERVLF